MALGLPTRDVTQGLLSPLELTHARIREHQIEHRTEYKNADGCKRSSLRAARQAREDVRLPVSIGMSRRKGFCRAVRASPLRAGTRARCTWLAGHVRRALGDAVREVRSVIIVCFSLPRIAQNLVGFLNRPESLRGCGVTGIEVWVILSCERSIGAANLLRRRLARNSQDLVKVSVRGGGGRASSFLVGRAHTPRIALPLPYGPKTLVDVV